MNNPLISFDELQAELGKPDLRLVDASWYLPAQNRNGYEEFQTAHIPGAVFFDQDDVVDPHSDLPHALPPGSVFADKVGAMGIACDHHIVVYDGPGMFTAPRVWWMFRAMGAHCVQVLNGGFDQWKAESRPVSDERSQNAVVGFDVTFDADQVVSLAQMRNIIEGQSEFGVIDARSRGRFSGEDAEPRAGMRSGHMPGARNVPFVELVENGRLKQPGVLRSEFKRAGVKLDQMQVTTCGSGVTAAVINLALLVTGAPIGRLYDGSWSEWGSLVDTQVTRKYANDRQS